MEMFRIVTLLWVIVLLWGCRLPEKQKETGSDFELLKYNHPELVVDLGVGLWAWPLPLDYDNDGDMDLLVSCPDTPFNGTYFFENTSGKTEKMPVFAPPQKIEKGDKNLQVSWVDGKPRLLGRGVEYKNFIEKGFRRPFVLFPVEEVEREFNKIRFSQWKYADYDGDGDQDLIAGISDWGDYGWDNAFDENGNWTNGPLHGYLFYLENVNGEYKSRGKIRAGNKPIDVYGAPSPNPMDFDNDGDLDLITGNSAGYIGFIENLDGGSPPRWNKPVYLKAEGEVIRIMAGENGSIQGPAERKWGYTTLSVADWDGDGLNDIIANSIFGKIIWYKNVGSPAAPILEKARPIEAEFGKNTPKPAWNWWNPEQNHLVTQWRTTPYAIDWNKDGLTDLIMLDTEGYLSYYERYLEKGVRKLKPGQRIFYGTNGSVFDSKNNVVDESPGLLRLNNREAGGSGRRKLCVADWDGDGDRDLIVNSVNASLFENVKTENGNVYFRHAGPLSAKKIAGHTTSPTIVNWGKGKLPELLLGAEDGHFYHLSRN
jgi:hypothetical protein